MSAADASGASGQPLTPRQVTWERRKASTARTWAEFRRHRSGVLGLIVLVFFVLVAVFAPLLADPDGLSRTQATGAIMAPPTSGYPLGTDEYGRSVLTLLIYGARVSLFVGLVATVISMVLGTLVGIGSGFLGGRVGGLLYRLTEWFLVIPF